MQRPIDLEFLAELFSPQALHALEENFNGEGPFHLVQFTLELNPKSQQGSAVTPCGLAQLILSDSRFLCYVLEPRMEPPTFRRAQVASDLLEAITLSSADTDLARLTFFLRNHEGQVDLPHFKPTNACTNWAIAMGFFQGAFLSAVSGCEPLRWASLKTSA